MHLSLEQLMHQLIFDRATAIQAASFRIPDWISRATNECVRQIGKQAQLNLCREAIKTLTTVKALVTVCNNQQMLQLQIWVRLLRY